MSIDEKDLELKLRTMRYLWGLGYFVRRNIDLVEYGHERSRVYTDIDVLGVKLDEEFASHYVVCDCKSGTKVKTPERLFWLSGVMDYFGGTKGLFIRNQVMGAKYIELSKRLKITPLSISQLSDFEKNLAIPQRFYGSFCEEQKSVDAIFSELKKYDLFSHDYLLKRYWKDQPQQQILTLAACCRRIKKVKLSDEYKQTFVLIHTLSSLSLSILRFANILLMVPSNERETIVKYELLGGEVSFTEREKLTGAFYDFMVREIQERYKEKYPLTKSEFLENMIPDYSKYLADLVVRFCQEPVSSICVPRLMDLFAFEFTLNNRKVSINDAMPASMSKISLRPLLDFLTFAERGGLITENLKALSKEYMKALETA